MSPRDRALPARLVLATGNAGKLREMRAILAPWGVDVRPQSEFTRAAAEETGLSFVENAILKARFAAEVSGLPAIADDSGLEVDALHGAPGIYSARYAGPGADDAANNARLLRDLETVAHELAHLREMNHSAAFWDVVRSVLPDYERARGTLRDDVLPVFD